MHNFSAAKWLNVFLDTSNRKPHVCINERATLADVAAPFVLMHANAAFYKGLLHNARLLCVKQRYLHTGIECEIITHRAGSQSYLQCAIYAHSHMCSGYIYV